MRKETRALIIERYTGWIETWGLSLAFAVTQSLENSERLVADAIVSLIATATEDEISRIAEARLARRFQRDRVAELTDHPAPVKPIMPGDLIVGVSAQRFAALLWEMADAQAFRGFGADPFFRMPAVARAIVILKIKGQFSRNQIAGITRLTPALVDNHLENARLLFSDGRPWVEASPGLLVENTSWSPECPRWRSSAPQGTEAEHSQISEVFAQYVGNDLDSETGTRLHSHLLVCNDCRSNLGYFKRRYGDWVSSIPSIEPAAAQRKQFTKITSLALGARRRTTGDAPRALPGLRRLARDSTIHAMVLGAALVLLFQTFAHRHPSLLAPVRSIAKGR